MSAIPEMPIHRGSQGHFDTKLFSNLVRGNNSHSTIATIFRNIQLPQKQIKFHPIFKYSEDVSSSMTTFPNNQVITLFYPLSSELNNGDVSAVEGDHVQHRPLFFY